MKMRFTIATILMLIFSLTTLAQDDEYIGNAALNDKCTTYKLESSNIEDFKSISWDEVKATFQGLKPTDNIALKFKYKKPLQVGKAQTEAFNFKYEGKATELENFIAKSKKTLATIVDVEGQNF